MALLDVIPPSFFSGSSSERRRWGGRLRPRPALPALHQPGSRDGQVLGRPGQLGLPLGAEGGGQRQVSARVTGAKGNDRKHSVFTRLQWPGMGTFYRPNDPFTN